MFGKFSSKPKIVFTAAGALNLAGNPAQVGEQVGSIVDYDGNVTLNAVPNSNIVLEERDGVLEVVCYAGGFAGDESAALVPFHNSESALHMCGRVEPGLRATFASFITLSDNNNPTNNSTHWGIKLRPNWLNGGFNGVDSYAFLGSGIGGVLSNTFKYQLGSAGHHHNLVISGSVADNVTFYESGDKVENTPFAANTVVRGDSDIIQIGIHHWNPADGSYSEGVPIRFSSLGVWRNMTAAESQELSLVLSQNRPSRKIVCYGDSRTFSLNFPGSFEEQNKQGYHFVRRAFNGISIDTGNSGNPSIEAMIAEDISDGLRYDAATILTGTNSFPAANDPQPPLDALINAVDDLLETGTVEHVFISSDVPRINTGFSQSDQENYLEYSKRLTRHFSTTPRVTVVETRRAFQAYDGSAEGIGLEWESRFTTDNTHWTLEGYRRYMVRLVGMITEHFGDADFDTHTRANEIAVSEVLRRIQSSDIIGSINGIPTATEAAILDEGDATPLLAAIAAKVEEFVNSEGDANATIAAISSAVWSRTTRTLTSIDFDEVIDAIAEVPADLLTDPLVRLNAAKANNAIQADTEYDFEQTANQGTAAPRARFTTPTPPPAE